MSASPSSGAMYELAGETGLGVVRVASDGGYGMAWSLHFCPRWRTYVSLAAAVFLLRLCLSQVSSDFT